MSGLFLERSKTLTQFMKLKNVSFENEAAKHVGSELCKAQLASNDSTVSNAICVYICVQPYRLQTMLLKA